MNIKQLNQFNAMLEALKAIGEDFQTPDQLREDSYKMYGLEFEDAIEMAYDNIQETAKQAIKGVKPLNN